MTTVEFRLNEVAEDGERLLTTCTLSVHVDDIVVWPARGADNPAIEIQIDDLLSHLTEFWKPLALRQTYPLTLNPSLPSQLRSVAEQSWERLPKQQVIEEDRVVEAFQDCHDISRCFAGYFDLPALWLIRSGEGMLIDTVKQFDRVPYKLALDALSAAGDWIANRLAGAESGRWADIIAAWHARNTGDGIAFLRWSTSLDETTARSLADEGLLSPPATMEEAANDNNELRLAARMASALPPEQVRAVLARVAEFPKKSAPRLDELAAAVRTHLDAQYSEARPFEQGEAIADFVRERAEIPRDTKVDIFGFVEDLGVQIDQESFGLPTLDALAVWGDQHGPATLINTASQRHDGPGDFAQRGQTRVTLAHELCHFLVDREHALGAVDVLRSRMPVAIEQRARAFAAEFLLPGKAASEAWLAAEQPRDREGLETVLEHLCKHFTISKSVASWKLEHGTRVHGVDLSPILESIVPQR